MALSNTEVLENLTKQREELGEESPRRSSTDGDTSSNLPESCWCH